MPHLAENVQRLSIHEMEVSSYVDLLTKLQNFHDVCVVRLPMPNNPDRHAKLRGIGEIIAELSTCLADTATLIIIGDVIDLVEVHAHIAHLIQYQLWIAIKRKPIRESQDWSALPHAHFGALIYTRYRGQLQHTKTRLGYSYCPACNKTTKDYGGKKHTYHHYGTLISDIWRDIAVDPTGDIQEVLERFADLFGIPQYQELLIFDLAALHLKRSPVITLTPSYSPDSVELESNLLHGDCLTELYKLPDNSADFVFADPPYNLKKAYRGYADDLSISDYFLWCDQWISEIARILRPGGTFALLNIPLWSIRHFLHLQRVLEYQNWIAWDALSFPVRMIMPAHYTILCFSKGKARPLPGLVNPSERAQDFSSSTFRPLQPLDEDYCLRAQCVSKRRRLGVNDRGVLSDLWWDIHRLKHNTRRVDHPCQLPPQLMYRLIELFSYPGEVVLDCFNGTGTTTLAAHQLGRRYIGVEAERHYYELALERHREIEQGIDPFRKQERVLTSKNSPVARVKKQKYEVPKKTLQLEVRRVANLLDRLPNRDEMIQHGRYPIRYYDEYFASWGEVCAAARTTGMSEVKAAEEIHFTPTSSQPRLF